MGAKAVSSIKEMKVGDRLIFGRYGVRNEEPEPIVWLKATPNNDFISERALDYLMFDAGEGGNPSGNFRYNGNPVFQTSNMFCFLNSDLDDWYVPMHEYDQPPHATGYPTRRFRNHFGFLYDFYDYEDESLCQISYPTAGLDYTVAMVTSKIRLPASGDIYGANCFPLFKKKGIRPKATDGLVSLGYGFDDTSYIPFWTRDVTGMSVKTIARDGYERGRRPTDSCGLRPVCTIKGDILVSIDEFGNYAIIPYRAEGMEVFSDDDILKLFGVIA